MTVDHFSLLLYFYLLNLFEVFESPVWRRVRGEEPLWRPGTAGSRRSRSRPPSSLQISLELQPPPRQVETLTSVGLLLVLGAGERVLVVSERHVVPELTHDQPHLPGLEVEETRLVADLQPENKIENLSRYLDSTLS